MNYQANRLDNQRDKMMKADKVTVKIEMETLSIQTLRGMLMQVIEQVDREVETGELSMQDGDCIKWATTRENVEF